MPRAAGCVGGGGCRDSRGSGCARRASRRGVARGLRARRCRGSGAFAKDSRTSRAAARPSRRDPAGRSKRSSVSSRTSSCASWPRAGSALPCRSPSVRCRDWRLRFHPRSSRGWGRCARTLHKSWETRSAKGPAIPRILCGPALPPLRKDSSLLANCLCGDRESSHKEDGAGRENLSQ